MLSCARTWRGTASGLRPAINYPFGRRGPLSALAGALLTGGNGAYPLILIKLVTQFRSSAVLSILIALYRRERQVNG